MEVKVSYLYNKLLSLKYKINKTFSFWTFLTIKRKNSSNTNLIYTKKVNTNTIRSRTGFDNFLI